MRIRGTVQCHHIFHQEFPGVDQPSTLMIYQLKQKRTGSKCPVLDIKNSRRPALTDAYMRSGQCGPSYKTVHRQHRQQLIGSHDEGLLLTCTCPSPCTPGTGNRAVRICRPVCGFSWVRCATCAQQPAACVDCTVAGPVPPAQRTALQH